MRVRLRSLVASIFALTKPQRWRGDYWHFVYKFSLQHLFFFFGSNERLVIFWNEFFVFAAWFYSRYAANEAEYTEKHQNALWCAMQTASSRWSAYFPCNSFVYFLLQFHFMRISHVFCFVSLNESVIYAGLALNIDLWLYIVQATSYIHYTE